ncbi:MAG: MMPL family transporter, partial [Hyphomicrobiales bacterium]|nr:MMPL family transporter [Hyphomicrobiales bacterium]
MNAPPPSPEHQTQSSIGFNLERIGIFAVSRPLYGTIAVVIISLIAAFGLWRLEFDDELRNVFRSNSADHQAFEKFEATFGATETDLFLLVEGDSLATPAGLNALRNFTIDLRLEDGVASAVSLFSLRRTPDKDGEAPPVVPTEIPDGKDLRILLDAIDNHPLGLGKLISADRRSALVIIAIEEEDQGLRESRIVASTVKSLANRIFSPVGLTSRLTGLPELRTELVDRLLVDQSRVIVIGIGLAFLLSGIMFRSISGSIVTTLPAIVAVFWVLGLMGIIGVRVNLTTSILPVLILVLAFADSMHLSVQSLREQIAGRTRRAAALAAIREVGPACVLAALTTAGAFLTLVLSDSYAIRQLGITGSIATMLSFASVVVVGPLLFELTSHRSMKVPSDTGVFFHALTVFARFCWRIGTKRPLITVVIGTLLVLAAGWGHSRLRPEFSFKEHLGNTIPAVQAMSQINREFGGSNPVH